MGAATARARLGKVKHNPSAANLDAARHMLLLHVQSGPRMAGPKMSKTGLLEPSRQNS